MMRFASHSVAARCPFATKAAASAAAASFSNTFMFSAGVSSIFAAHRFASESISASAANAEAFAARAAASAAARKTGIAGDPGAAVDVAAFSPLPANAVQRLPEVDRTWLAIDGAHRQRLAKFAQGGARFCGTKALAARTEGIKKHNASDAHCLAATVQPKIGAAVKAFVGAKDVPALFESYNELSLLLKALEREREIVQLEIWGYNDIIHLGLKFYPADKIASTKKAREAALKRLAATQELFHETVASAFTTGVMNDMLNILRISFVANGDGNARELGVQLLDDFSLCRVPFNAETQLLMRNLVFGDMPHEDSGLLFEMVEASTGGSVSVQRVGFGASPSQWSAEMDKLSDETLHVISKRFQTPYSPEMLKAKLTETHPMLERSEI